jgi:hypothetical protein
MLIDLSFYMYVLAYCQIIYFHRGHRGHDRMVVGFTTTYAISAYYVIKFVIDLRHVSGFLRVLRFPLPIKLTAVI